MRLAYGFGVVMLASFLFLPACEEDDPAPAGAVGGKSGSGDAGAAGLGGTSAAAGTGGTSAAGGADASGGSSGATVDPSGTYELTFTTAVDSCADLAPLEPTTGTLEITAVGGAVTAKFGGWPADQMTPLVGTSTIPGSQDGDTVSFEMPPGAEIDISGCTTQWRVGAIAKVDGSAVSGSFVLSRGASTSTACTDQGIKPCPRGFTFFGQKK